MIAREYVCPHKIVEIFDEDEAKGRELAFAWARTLTLEAYDRVWFPDTGWVEHNPEYLIH